MEPQPARLRLRRHGAVYSINLISRSQSDESELYLRGAEAFGVTAVIAFGFSKSGEDLRIS